jgi:hypothetical protein
MLNIFQFYTRFSQTKIDCMIWEASPVFKSTKSLFFGGGYQ